MANMATIAGKVQKPIQNICGMFKYDGCSFMITPGELREWVELIPIRKTKQKNPQKRGFS